MLCVIIRVVEMRVLRNGNAPAFQAGHVGSIPITRSILPLTVVIATVSFLKNRPYSIRTRFILD